MRYLGTAALVLALAGASPAQALTKDQRNVLISSLAEQFSRCFSPPIQSRAGKALLKLRLERNGRLADVQVLEPKPGAETDDAFIKMVERMVRRCAPYRVPEKFKAFHDQWKELTLVYQWDL